MHLNVVTTLRCNLRCPHCLLGCPKDVDLLPKTLHRTVDDLMEHGLASVTFTGGEPILHPALGDMVEDVAGRGLAFGFVSNGWRHEGYAALTRGWSGRAEMALSLDGLGSTHDAVRGGGSFHRVVAGVRRFVRMGVPTSVNFTVTDENREELAPAVSLAASLGAAGVKVAGRLPAGGGTSRVLSAAARPDVYHEATRLSRRHGIPVRVANSVYHPVTVEFCPVLTHDVVSLDASGHLTFCCDIPGSGARLGATGTPAHRLLKRRAEVVNEILLHRILEARTGPMPSDDQSCLYCFHHFGAPA